MLPEMWNKDEAICHLAGAILCLMTEDLVSEKYVDAQAKIFHAWAIVKDHNDLKEAEWKRRDEKYRHKYK